MALRGSFSGSVYNGHYRLRVEWSATQDIANNTSTITANMYIDTDYSLYIWTRSNNTTTIDGSSQTYSSPAIQTDTSSSTHVGTVSKTVSHNADGTKSLSISSVFQLNATISDIYYATISASANITLDTIPRQANLTSAPNFNDEENPTIGYSNSAGNSVSSLQACISLTGSTDDIAYRDVSKTGTSYTFNLTTAERNVLRNSCTTSNSRTVIFFLRTVIGGNTFYSTLNKTLTIINGNPTFTTSNVSYADTNSTTTAVTQNNQQLVQNLSNLLVTLTGATAKKGASITRYEATINNVTKTRTSAGTIDFGVINSGSNLTLTVKVIDSRGNSTTVSKTVQFLAWTLPTAIISLKRKNNYENETYLQVNSTYSSVNSKNSITIQYQYKKTTETNYSSLTTISNNTRVTISKDKEYAWDFKIKITDRFGNTTYNTILSKGKFILFVDTKKLSVGVNCFPTNNESLEVNGQQIGAIDFNQIYPVGSIFLSVNSTSPATLFGGTWTQISNRFLYCTTSGATNTGGASSVTYTPAGTVGGHTLTLSEIPAHNHKVTNSTTSYGAGSQSAWRCLSWSGTSHDYWQDVYSENAGGGGSHNHGFTGTQATISTMPPYMKVYAWYRTA